MDYGLEAFNGTGQPNKSWVGLHFKESLAGLVNNGAGH